MILKRKKAYKQLLASDPQKLFELLGGEIKEDSSKSNEMIQLISRYKRLVKDSTLNVISNSEFDKRLSKLTFDSIQFLDSLEEEDLLPNLTEFSYTFYDVEFSEIFIEDGFPDENYYKRLEYLGAYYRKLSYRSDGKELKDFFEKFWIEFQKRIKYHSGLFDVEFKCKKINGVRFTRIQFEKLVVIAAFKEERFFSQLLVVTRDNYNEKTDSYSLRLKKRFNKKYDIGLNENLDIAWKFDEPQYLSNKEFSDLLIRTVISVYLKVGSDDDRKEENSSEQGT